MGRPDDDTPRRRSLLAGITGWLIAVPLAFITFTQMFAAGSSSVRVYELQSIAPYVLPLGLPVAVVALLGRRRALAAVAAVGPLCWLVLAMPLIAHPDPPQVDADAPTVSVLHANLLYTSGEIVDEADAVLDARADVLALSEFTPAMAAALDALGALEDYPYRVGVPEGGTEGIAIWSRYPLTDAVSEPIGARRGAVATVAVDGRELRVVVAHPVPPLTDAGQRDWIPSLEAINALTRAGDLPTLLVADLNASWWHPPYRRTLSDGLVDVHRVLGDGFSVSWPRGHRLPPFTRIDHALIDGAVSPLGIDDLTLPGSDHEAFVVRVAVGEPGAD